MQDLVIRKPNENDAKEIINYLNKVGGESDNLLFSKNEFLNVSLESQINIIKNFNNSEKDIMILGLLNNEIVSIGFLQGFQKERISHRASVAISVKKEFWGKSIGKIMMKNMINFAKNLNFKVIELQVKEDNLRAINLYESLGFKKIGSYEKFFKINNKFYNVILMNIYL